MHRCLVGLVDAQAIAPVSFAAAAVVLFAVAAGGLPVVAAFSVVDGAAGWVVHHVAPGFSI